MITTIISFVTVPFSKYWYLYSKDVRDQKGNYYIILEQVPVHFTKFGVKNLTTTST